MADTLPGAALVIPTWPQLAGWLATSTIVAASGEVRGADIGDELVRFACDGDRLELRWTDGRRYVDDGTRAVRVEADGAAALAPHDEVARAIRAFLHPPVLDRDGYHRAIAAPVAVTAAGRAGWAVELVAPGREGRLQLVIDDETGCLLYSSYDHGEPQVEVLSLVLGAREADFSSLGLDPVDPMAAHHHEQALREAGPGPRVRLVPGGQGCWVEHADGDRVVVELDAMGVGTRLSVAPVGLRPLDPGPSTPHHRTRELGEYVWLVATAEPISDEDADAVFASACWLDPNRLLPGGS